MRFFWRLDLSLAHLPLALFSLSIKSTTSGRIHRHKQELAQTRRRGGKKRKDDEGRDQRA